VSGEGDENVANPAATAAPPATPPAPTRSFFDRYKGFIIVGIVIVAAVAAAFEFGWIGAKSGKNRNRLVLYGNVDLRQVDLAFNDSERLAEVLVQEGARVTRGQILARLDTSRLTPETATAAAVVAAQQAVVDRLHHGSRPEEIAQSRANVASAKADQVNALQQWTRLAALTTLTTGRAVSEQDLEAAKAALDSAQAHSNWPSSAPERRTSLRAKRSCGPIRPSSNCCTGSSRTPNWWRRVMPSCATGSWSPAKWFLRKGRYWISRLPIRSGFAPTFPSPISARFTPG
jgi:hypothetical protein